MGGQSPSGNLQGVNIYAIWCDTEPGQDRAFTKAVHDYLGALKDAGHIGGFTFERRKFGFGPEGLGEFQIRIEVKDLTQLDEAFNVVAHRSGPIEDLHAEVFRRTRNFKSALYRTFPDPQLDL